MNRFTVLLTVVVLAFGSQVASAQWVTRVAYYPATTVAYQPVTSCYAPVPVTTYYSPAPVVYSAPTAYVTTRYRPILGRAVTRVRYGYPSVFVPAPRTYVYWRY